MSSERAIEVSGETVEEAIAKGLQELGGVSPSDVIVEVLDEPSRGVLGFGARMARVRLQLFRIASPPPPPVAAAPPPSVSSDEPPPWQRPPRPVVELDEGHAEVQEDEGVSLLGDLHEIVDESEMDEDVRVAKVVLNELLERMGLLRFEIVVRRAAEPAPGETNNPWLLDITGSTITSLIGRRGETLNALQYITRLIVSREVQHRANIVVDAGGYKAKRSRQLYDLAIRMADQAVRSSRVVALEPMPPFERRIVHMALRSRPDVQTKSVGEGPARKVTIVPKQAG